MRIGIFVVMAGREAGGPETYEVELIRSLARLDQKNEYFIYCTGAYACQAIAIQQDNIVYRVLQPSWRWVSIPVTLPVLLRKDGIDVFHCTFAPPPFPTQPLVFTMHCISSFAHPEYYRRAVLWRLNSLQHLALKKARCILCVSENTRRDVHRQFGVPLERMRVTYNGVGERFCPAPEPGARRTARRLLGFDEPYVLYVGKLDPRKNLVRLIQAYALYRRETGSEARLVLAGRLGIHGEELAAETHRLGLTGQVVFPGYVETGDLPALYSAARMFVFPSLWEGFGIPLMEAMACGTPVATSNATCLPEIAGDAALCFAPESVDQMAQAMVDLESSAELRQRLIGRGVERAKLFSWENCARLTREAYFQVAAR